MRSRRSEMFSQPDVLNHRRRQRISIRNLEGRSMRTIRNLLAALLMIGLMAASGSSQWQRSSRGTFQSVQQLIRRIENRAALFRSSLDAELQRSSMDDMRAATRGQENITMFMNDSDDAVRRLHERFDRRESNATDAQEVLNRASLIDRFMSRRQLDSRT